MSAARILVVDDDPQIRRVMRVTLTAQGYEVDDAKNGEAALEILRNERFDLVLLDINMPGIGGLETCREIRAQSEIAIIMLTVRNADYVIAATVVGSSSLRIILRHIVPNAVGPIIVYATL